MLASDVKEAQKEANRYRDRAERENKDCEGDCPQGTMN
jgi:hypothetical protein